eukprot:8107985-Ditylum_brightwellii.AAC.1
MQVNLCGDPKYKDFDKQRDTIMRLWALYQEKDMSNLVFLECFNAIVDVVEGQGGVITSHTSLVT